MKKIYLFVWFIPFIFTSCEKELMPKKEELNESQYISTVSEEEFLNFLNSSYVKSTIKSSVKNDYDVENWRYEPIRNTNEFLAVIPYDYGIPGYSSRILMLKIMGELQTIVFHLKKDPVVNTSPYFTGLIRITNLEGNYISGYRVNNGSIVSKFVLKRNKDKTREKKCQEAYNLATDDFCNGTLEEVIIDAESDPSTTDNYIYIPYMYLDAPEKITDEEAGWNYIDGGGGGTTTTPTEEEDKINTDNLNNDCVEGIIDELKKKDAHLSVVADPEGDVSHLSQIMLNMFEKSSKYHLEFTIADATDIRGNARNAFTKTVNSTLGVTFRITLDDDYVINATQLAIARTIVHETLHGYLKYIYQEYNTSDLSQLIYKYWKDNSEDLNKSHHEVMTFFAEAMGASLAAWDNHRIPPPSDPNRLNYYEALSFSGDMIKSTAFSKLHNDDQDLIKLANKLEGDAVKSAESSAKSPKCP